MEHEVLAEVDGVVREWRSRSAKPSRRASCWDARAAGRGARRRRRRRPRSREPEGERADLRAVRERHEIGLDAARAEAVARRHEHGHRTARENLADLVDAGSFVEYGPLLFAAQERRRTREELIARTPADGLVGGVGDVDGPPLRGDVLRLHGPGGHPGHAQPRQEGPPVRARRAAPAAGRAVRRGRRRAAGRRRHADRGGARLPRVRPVRAAQRPRPARGRRGGLLLRRQRRAARLLRRGDRHRGLEHRHGRPGDDRGRRPRASTIPARSGRSTSSTPTASSTCASPTNARPSALARRYLSYFRGPAEPGAGARPRAAARRWSPSSASASTRSATVVEDAVRRGLGARAAARLGPGDGDRARAPRRAPAGRDRQRRLPPRRRDRRRRRRQGRPLPAAVRRASSCPSCSCATRRASWSARPPSGPRPCATSRACSWPEPTCRCRSGRSCCARATGSGAQAMAGGGFKAPLFTVGWPTSEFGAMGLEGAVRLGMRRELEAIEDPGERERALQRAGGRPPTSAAAA